MRADRNNDEFYNGVSITGVFTLKFLSIILVFLLLIVSACQNEVAIEEQAPVNAISVTTYELQPKSWQQNIQTYGRFESAETVNISVDFSATVSAVKFEQGEPVKSGQILIELDKRKQELRLEQAKANLATALANLEKARSTYERYRSLLSSKAISQEAYRQSKASYDATKASVEQSHAAQALAEQDLKETTVLSPVNGVVVSRDVEPGQTVLPGKLLGVVQVVDTFRVATYVTEAEINNLRLGGEAAVTTPGLPTKEFVGRIEVIGSSADVHTGNFPVKLALENTEGLMREGMSARIVFQGELQGNALLIPRSAVVDRLRKRLIYKVEEGKAVAVEPILGVSITDEVPVLAGLQPGDQIITSGLSLIEEGAVVDVIQ